MAPTCFDLTMLTAATSWSSNVDWAQLLITQIVVVVVGVLSSSAVAAWAKGRAESTGEDKRQAQKDLRRCLDTLGELRIAYRQHRPKLLAGQDVDDLDNLRDRFLIRASLCLSETIVTEAEKYITTADQYFSGSEDTVAVDEEQAFRDVAKAIRRANNKYTARLGRRR